jgi:hypothetical protein
MGGAQGRVATWGRCVLLNTSCDGKVKEPAMLHAESLDARCSHAPVLNHLSLPTVGSGCLWYCCTTMGPRTCARQPACVCMCVWVWLHVWR